ncbi:anti-sigma factor [Tessaracoccus sp. OS52]|uniref:anti-sigma factor domain-containing protein n=1 Tax=Tessaracoccus sp. OS52 TaxID=2886691 RepID=UPI001D126DFE|nr:anti-sigma factor [Tessaracoccus sp. OS52]MCC2592447.1 anti-sigma factor [Tessaracoccus sp. OS52]
MSEEAKYSLDDVARRFRRAAESRPTWSDPSPGTWEAIAAGAGLPQLPPAPAQPQQLPSAQRSPAAPGGPSTSRRAWLFGAGGVLAGGVLGALGMRLLTGPGDEALETVRRAILTPLDRPDDPRGTAELLRRDIGYSLAVEVPDGVANPDGYVEVWLINTDGQRMVSVGVFAAESVGRFAVDESLIESGYLIVDLSNEQFDDEPRHSGDTIVRGQLL